MHEKRGVTAVIFDVRNGKNFFLLLHRVLNWRGWEFLKGGIEAGELPEQALLREVEEESGLTGLDIVAKLPSKYTWTANDTRYIYTPFILRGNMGARVDLEQDVIEHDDYRWVEEEKVASLLTHEDNKRIFSESLEIIGGENAKD